jgi:hypothetical protein
MIVNSFATLINSKIVIPSSRSQYLAVDRYFLQFCLRGMIERITLDEAWYLRTYPDVAAAIRTKDVASAREHYLLYGYFENRLPYPIKIDERWYIEQYPDIAEAVKREQYRSAQAHFEEVGFSEGRLPYPNFALSK